MWICVYSDSLSSRHQSILSAHSAKMDEEEAPGVECLDVAKDAFQCGKVWFARIMHVQANLLNCIGDIRTGEGKVLESTGETPEI